MGFREEGFATMLKYECNEVFGSRNSAKFIECIKFEVY